MDRFRTNEGMQNPLRPPTPADLPSRLLGVWAHPDDEAYLSAGLMADVVRAGGTVTIVCLTDGELGFGADDTRSATDKAAQRRAELRRAAAVVGVDDVRFLGVRDGALGDADLGIVAAAVADVMEAVVPDLTITFGTDGVTGHVDHVACGRAATKAWLDTGIGELRYAAKTDAWHDEWAEFHELVGAMMDDDVAAVAADQIDITIDVDGKDLVRKREALRAHASQTAAVAALMGEENYNRWFAQECFRPPTSAELVSLVSASTPAVRRAPARPTPLDRAVAH